MPAGNSKQGSPPLTLSTALWVVVAAAVVGFAAVYVTLGRPDNAVHPAGNALSQGQMAKFVFKREPEALPEARFVDAGGAERTLADWRGRVVLLNLWATWCEPCRREMPSLDRLQRDLGSDRFEVVAISVDRSGIAGARKFLDETKVEKLALYADPTARLSAALKVPGLPATLLIDAQGREVGRLLGPAEWDGEDARRLIGSVLK